MKTLVVDTNVVLSAAISDSKTRELIVNLEHQLVAPEAIYREIWNHRNLIKQKSGLEEDELVQLLSTLFKYIEIVPDTDVERRRERARQELAGVDQKDLVFLAAALVVEGGIWSDDEHLRQQELVEVHTTQDIVEQVYDPSSP